MEAQSISIPVAQLKNWGQFLKKRFIRMNRLFFITVLLPTFLAIIYFGFIAADVYISESRFVVRSPDRQVATGLGALLKSTGFSRSQDDSYTVQDVMRSRDALKIINTELPLDKAFGGSNGDIISRFNSLGLDGSQEALYRYYQNKISIDLDSSSSISTLKVNAFKAEDAYRINSLLLELAERLVNQLNQRGRQDMIRFAMSEVEIAEQKAKAANLALAEYRNQQGIFDPERQSAMQLQLVSKLQDELIAAQTQLEQVRVFTPENPQIPVLQKRVSTLQSEINKQMSKVAGGNASLTKKSAEYERLVLERGFAEKQLAAALVSLEQARNDAQRKQLYLERIVQPSKPDVAVEPRRLRAILTTLVLGLICWGIFTILLSGVREHRD